MEITDEVVRLLVALAYFWKATMIDDRQLKIFLAVAFLVLPFLVLLVGIFVNSPTVGTLAGTLAARITDPINLLAMAGCLFLGFSCRLGLAFSAGIGLAAGLFGSFMGFEWWAKVVGNVRAVDMAMSFTLTAFYLCSYTATIGFLIRLSRQRAINA